MPRLHNELEGTEGEGEYNPIQRYGRPITTHSPIQTACNVRRMSLGQQCLNIPYYKSFIN